MGTERTPVKRGPSDSGDNGKMPTEEEAEQLLAEQEPEAPEGDLLSQLRSKRESITTDRTTTLDIPGYGRQLVAKYRFVHPREMRKALKRVRQRSGSEPTEQELNVAAATLVRACEEILIRDEEGGTLTPLREKVESFGDEPVRYDERLAKAVGIDQGVNPLVCVRLVFNNPYALMAHFADLDAWLQDSSEDDDEDF